MKVTDWTTCTTPQIYFSHSLLISFLYKIIGKAWGQRKSGGMQDQPARKLWASRAMDNMSYKTSHPWTVRTGRLWWMDLPPSLSHNFNFVIPYPTTSISVTQCAEISLHFPFHLHCSFHAFVKKKSNTQKLHLKIRISWSNLNHYLCLPSFQPYICPSWEREKSHKTLQMLHSHGKKKLIDHLSLWSCISQKNAQLFSVVLSLPFTDNFFSNVLVNC